MYSIYRVKRWNRCSQNIVKNVGNIVPIFFLNIVSERPHKTLSNAYMQSFLRFLLPEKISGHSVSKNYHRNKMKHILTTRAQVVALKNAGHSQRDTARVIGKPLSFVERWWNRNDLLDRHAGGNPVKITRSLINEVHRRIQKKTRFSSRLVARDMSISQTTHTVHNLLIGE